MMAVPHRRPHTHCSHEWDDDKEGDDDEDHQHDRHHEHSEPRHVLPPIALRHGVVPLAFRVTREHDLPALCEVGEEISGALFARKTLGKAERSSINHFSAGGTDPMFEKLFGRKP
jgi:hypothetical protein